MGCNTTNGTCGIDVMERAFSPYEELGVGDEAGLPTWGVAPGWYEIAPSALDSNAPLQIGPCLNVQTLVPALKGQHLVRRQLRRRRASFPRGHHWMKAGMKSRLRRSTPMGYCRSVLARMYKLQGWPLKVVATGKMTLFPGRLWQDATFFRWFSAFHRISAGA
jgi:hypothetical protein